MVPEVGTDSDAQGNHALLGWLWNYEVHAGYQPQHAFLPSYSDHGTLGAMWSCDRCLGVFPTLLTCTGTRKSPRVCVEHMYVQWSFTEPQTTQKQASSL